MQKKKLFCVEDAVFCTLLLVGVQKVIPLQSEMAKRLCISVQNIPLEFTNKDNIHYIIIEHYVF